MKLKIFNQINRDVETNGGFGEDVPSLEQRMKTTFAAKLTEVNVHGDEGEEGTFTPEQLAAQAEKRQKLEEEKKLEDERLAAEKLKTQGKPNLGFSEEDDDGDKSKGKPNGGNDDNSSQHAVSYLLNKHGYNTDEFKEAFADLNLESDDIDDIAKFYELRDNLVKKSAVDEFLSTSPELKGLADHLAEGRSIDTWKQKTEAFNWKGFEIKEDDLETQEKVYSFLLKQKGLDDDEIKDQVELAKDRKILFTKAKDAQDKLDVSEKARIKSIEDAELAAINTAREAEKKTIKEVTDIILSGNINGYVLPEKTRKETLNFIMSGEREKKYERLPLAAKILLDEIVRTYDEKEGKFTIKGLEAVKNTQKPAIKINGKKPNLDSDNNGDVNDNILTIKDLAKRKPQFQSFD